MMKYLMAIALAAFGFASIATTPAHAVDDEPLGTCAERDADYFGYKEKWGTDSCRRSAENVDDVEPLAEIAQGDDVEVGVGVDDFGGEDDRAAASTVAE